MITDTKTLASKLRGIANQILLGQPARDCIEAAYRLEQLEKAVDQWRARHAATLADLTDCKRKLELISIDVAEWQNMAHSRKLQADAAMRELEREKRRAEENGKLAHDTAIDLAAERALADRLAGELESATNIIGPHFIRSCGTCDQCGGNTSSGTMKRCIRCGVASIHVVLAAWKEARR